jgi:glycosyltransferase involved in cell wall biosynthesis
MISVIMPVYNGEKYLRQSIESVIQQTYKDWELIIVNDCSTDNSRDIMQSYADADSRIRIVDKQQFKITKVIECRIQGS